jgi:hypothetical protein
MPGLASILFPSLPPSAWTESARGSVRCESAAFGFATGTWVSELDWVQREFVTYDPRPADTLPA